ncbi:transcriptional regulator, TetR family [Lentzea albida]|uniref:Transcriptional regulator, TetR family n=2 Tax=Lentzea albida TaxID=65499 RepID=A0A1H9MN06_9PSEU|nr:transcriptional regulator, TetR family [Lentzea albida]
MTLSSHLAKLGGMTSRAESAAATRRALLDAAGELLDLGGPEAVTLREVGGRVGMTRGAPYRHFADKEALLIAVGTQAWERLADTVRTLRSDPAIPPADKLRGALIALVDIGRRRPHLFRLMFTDLPSDPTALYRAAQPSHDDFVAILLDLVGERNAQRYGALLIASVTGIAGMEVADHLKGEKWNTSAEELVDTLVTLIANAEK